MLTPEQMDAVFDRECDTTYDSHDFDTILRTTLEQTKSFKEFVQFCGEALTDHSQPLATVICMAISMGYLMGQEDLGVKTCD